MRATMVSVRSWSILLTLAGACAPPEGDDEEAITQAVLNGTVVDPENSGHVVTTCFANSGGYLVNMGKCSGELVRNKWVLTARHCYDDYPDVYADVQMGTQKRRSIQVIRRPDSDLALLELDQPMQMPGSTNYSFARPLESFRVGLHQLYAPTTFQIFGYANTTTLKTAYTNPTDGGQNIETNGSYWMTGSQPGDSGGGLYAMTPFPTLVGVAYSGDNLYSDTYTAVRPLREWLYQTMYPASALLCHATECLTTMPSLPHNLSISPFLWTPCQGGPFRLEGELDLQAGDTLTIKDILGTDTLSGYTSVLRKTSGNVYLSMHTDGSVASRGVRSLRAICQ